MEKIIVGDKLALFTEYWSPRIIGELNESYVKVVKLKGEFVWHSHAAEDELFYVLKGRLVIRLREKNVILTAGEFLIIPKGIEHLPVAEEEVHVMLIESKTTLNTGDVKNERTVENLDKI